MFSAPATLAGCTSVACSPCRTDGSSWVFTILILRPLRLWRSWQQKKRGAPRPFPLPLSPHFWTPRTPSPLSPPTASHAGLAERALKKGVHCFIEKPVTTTLAEAEALIHQRDAASRVVQVGHVERFNPAFEAARAHLEAPRFIEAHRLAPFNPRGLDVPVVLDLMIHDIDLALYALEGDVVRVAANGVPVVGSSVDIANARLEFSSGAVANLTASRVSITPMRKVRLFQPDAYLSVDLLNRSAQVIRLEDVDEGSARDPYGMYLDVPGRTARRLHIEAPEVGETNAIAEELTDFHAACTGRAHCRVSLEDGLSALRVATEVMQRIEHSLTPTS